MLVKADKNLIHLAKVAGKTTTEISRLIVELVTTKEIVTDSPENWGLEFIECYERNIAVSEVVDIIRELGINPVGYSDVNAFFHLVFMGSGNCPECGGEMEITDEETEIVAGDGYNTPYEYAPVWQERTCNNCGYKESNEPDNE